jgi:hypothetical protein
MLTCDSGYLETVPAETKEKLVKVLREFVEKEVEE